MARKNRPEIEATGLCFPWALRYLLDHPDVMLCHGMVTEPMASDPRVYSHAWIETPDGLVLDWQTMESYFGGKWRGVGYPIDVFYELYDPEYISRYTFEQAAWLRGKTRHEGPWQPLPPNHWKYS